MKRSTYGTKRLVHPNGKPREKKPLRDSARRRALRARRLRIERAGWDADALRPHHAFRSGGV